jgi:hypothetical protein
MYKNSTEIDIKEFMPRFGLGFWCLMPLSKKFNYIVAVSFIGGGNRRKPPVCRKWS